VPRRKRSIRVPTRRRTYHISLMVIYEITPSGIKPSVEVDPTQSIAHPGVLGESTVPRGDL
jgi:hypothetical protein